MTGPGDAAKEAGLVSESNCSCSPQPNSWTQEKSPLLPGGCYSASLMLGKVGGAPALSPVPWGSCPTPSTVRDPGLHGTCPPRALAHLLGHCQGHLSLVCIQLVS